MAERKTKAGADLESGESGKAYSSASSSLKNAAIVREANPVIYGQSQSKAKGKSLEIDPAKLIVEQVTGLATWVLGSSKVAKAFLNRAHPMLDGLTPIKAIETEEGKKMVERILFNIEYGLPA